jgi:hypothetical protein
VVGAHSVLRRAKQNAEKISVADAASGAATVQGRGHCAGEQGAGEVAAVDAPDHRNCLGRIFLEKYELQ